MSEKHKMEVWSTSTDKKHNAVADINKDNKQEHESPTKGVIQEFGDETTHHGIRMITNPKYNIFKR